MTDQSSLPQSEVLVTSCEDCPFAAGDGYVNDAKCLLESPVIGPGPGSVKMSFLAHTRPKHCPLVLGHVVVKLAERRQPAGVGREQLAAMLKAIEEGSGKGEAE